MSGRAASEARWDRTVRTVLAALPDGVVAPITVDAIVARTRLAESDVRAVLRRDGYRMDDAVTLIGQAGGGFYRCATWDDADIVAQALEGRARALLQRVDERRALMAAAWPEGPTRRRLF